MSIHDPNLIDTSTRQERELTEAWRAVANAKFKEYRRQCWRLAALTQRGIVTKTAAVDRLWEIAIAHALVRSLGEDHVQAIIAEPFVAVETAA
jgi:hypothetical protein